MVKKVSLFLIGILMLCLIAAGMYVFFAPPEIPRHMQDTIATIVSSETSQLIRGDTGYAFNGNVKIWYESIMPADTVKGTILMHMGIGNDAMAWPRKFTKRFVDAGFRVIIYDYRGTGMSDWLENRDDIHYSLSDMADDGIAILDELNIEHSHLLGISMGGMVAQQMAIEHPDRIKSLISMMSTGHIDDPDLPKLSMNTFGKIAATVIKYNIFQTEKNAVKLQVAIRLILRGDTTYRFNVEGLAKRVVYNLRERNGYNQLSSKQHSEAIALSGSRYEHLKTLGIPALIIHGTKDPLIPLAHSKKYAALIPEVETFWAEGLGHDIPDVFSDMITEKILSFYIAKGFY